MLGLEKEDLDKVVARVVREMKRSFVAEIMFLT
jgi:hypothetical protein